MLNYLIFNVTVGEKHDNQRYALLFCSRTQFFIG